MSYKARREFLDGPGGKLLCVVYFGCSAGSSDTAPWLRAVSAVFLVSAVYSLAKLLFRRVRDRAPSEHPDGSAP